MLIMNSLRRKFFGAILFLFVCSFNTQAQQNNSATVTQIVFTSDVHYGIWRKHFRGADEVPAYIVNAAQVKQINKLPDAVLPNDNGIAAGKKISYIDYIAVTGDIANRQEPPSQSASISWKQFINDYVDDITAKSRNNHQPSLLLVPGNHDVSNAIGYSKPMDPLTDAGSMAGIYNLMMQPAVPKTKDTYNYATDKINYSKDIAGVHFIFITIWPDASNIAWMQNDLAKVKPSVPVVIFTHDPPEGDPQHFINPHEPHTINAKDKFQNLLSEQFKDDPKTEPLNDDIEQRAFVAFLKLHPNIKAYFHGHNNANEFYNYKGPDNDISLPVFRVDSPMKGKPSSTDETKLSFQLISIDPASKEMTVRECLWNTEPKNPTAPIVWGQSMTIKL